MRRSTPRKLLVPVLGIVVSAVSACSHPALVEPSGGASTGAGDGGSGGGIAQTTATGGGTTSGGQVSSSTGVGGAPAALDPSHPALPCVDAASDVYLAPNNLPPMDPSARGDVVRCAVDAELSLADVAATVSGKGISAEMTSGTNLFRIAFRTTRGDGAAGISTARVYLPTTPRAATLPILVVGHPTEGIADACAPSAKPSSNVDLALPWAGRGFAVIVPDYAGLGNEGAQAYLDNRDQGHALLDGARALRRLLQPGVFTPKIVGVGFSQGGGAILSMQALASSYGADGELVGAVAIAPEWPTRLGSFGFVDLLEHPEKLTIQTGISDNVIAVMRLYGWMYNALGPAHAGDAFPASDRQDMVDAVESQCLMQLGGYLQATAPHVGDNFDDAFRTSLLACIHSGGQSPDCVEPARSFHASLEQNVLAGDPTGAKILYVQGLSDYVLPPQREAACNVEKLEADGVHPELCIDAAAQHQTVVERNMNTVLAWGEALIDGAPLPTCSNTFLPPCIP
ncbi:MAG: lipase family protein [Polyangiaceae bacterium]